MRTTGIQIILPMKKICLLAGVLWLAFPVFSQVGIGTLAPNAKSLLELSSTSKGLLLPRLSASDRTAMALTAADAGMMVYQTTAPKGIYSFDGTNWIYHAPLDAGSATATTLRWDNSAGKWISTGNLFNGGGSIGINTTALNYQLNISSIATSTKMQLTSSGYGTLSSDGLILGINNTTSPTLPGVAHLLQQENKPLWFGTNGMERVRIDSVGNVGINTANPGATLDVNGTFKLGNAGMTLNGILRIDYEIDPPVLAANEDWIIVVPCANAVTSGVVFVSPSADMAHLMLAYARVKDFGSLEFKFTNMSSAPSADLAPVILHIGVIQ